MNSFLTKAQPSLTINQHLSTPTFSSIKIHWDNACSYNISNSQQLFQKLFPLLSPIPIGGIGGRCHATHAGYLKCLPATNYMNFALYSSDVPQTLLSLGQLHSCGGTYHSTKNPNILTITADNTTTLDITPLNDNSNLYNANISKILSILHANPHLLFSPTNPPTISQFTPSLRKFIQQHPPSTHSIPSIKLHAYLNNLPTNTTSPDDNLATKVEQPIHRKISSEQYRRVLAANDLHYINAHKPDAILCQELSTGKHPYSDLTSTDVLLMRKILGPCPHCPNEKPAAIRLPSQTLPAQNPGDMISFDPSKLPCPVLGGATHSITMVDEKAGHISLPGIPSKSNAAVTKGIQKIIHVNYNAHGHQVKSLHGDAERINTSLAPFLGSIGTTLKVSYPNHHAHRAERTTQTIDRKARAIFSHLPYILPPEPQAKRCRNSQQFNL